MERKKLIKGLSLILAMALVFQGNYQVPEVYAAETVSDPMADVIREEKMMEAQLQEEDEKEYLEEPEDYSWMQKLLEEEREKTRLEEPENQQEEMASSAGEAAEVPKEDAVLTEGEEPLEEVQQPEDIEVFQAPIEKIAEETPQTEDSERVFSEGGFGDGSVSVPDSQDELVPAAADAEYGVFTAGEPGTLFSEGGDPGAGDSGEDPSKENGFGSGDSDNEDQEPDSQDSELGETEATLQLEEGEDFITELNILLYKAKDRATDEKPYKVIIPPGNYEIKGTISMYSNIHLYAVGAVMKKTSTKKQILMRLGNSEISAGGYDGYRNITIEGGTWDCNYESCAKKEEPGGFVCFRLGHATNITVKDATFLNNLKSHFLEFGGVKHALVTGCTFEGYWTPYERTSQECIQIDACMDSIFPRYQPFDGTVCTDIVIENNTFQNVFAGAGSHSMMFDKPYTNIVIRNNRFINVKRRAVWLLNCKDSSVTGNVMKNVGGGVYIASMRSTHVHLLEGQQPTIKQNQQAQNVVVSGNTITLSSTTAIAGKAWTCYGIWIGGQRVKSASCAIPLGDYIIRGVTADKNIIKGPGNGIRLERTMSCKVTNNKLSLTKPANAKNFGIYAGGSRNNQITGNTVQNTANIGIYIYTNSGYTHKSTGNKLVSNQVKKSLSDGIRLGSGSNNTVLQKNRVSENKLNGIYVQSSSVTSMTYNRAESNGKCGIYCVSSTIKEQQKNIMIENKSAYAIRFYKCKGKVQNVKIPAVKTIKRTAKKITGTGAGGVKVYVYTKDNKRMAGAKIGKNWKFSVPIKAQKRGTVLSIRIVDKYSNAVRKEFKVV